MDILIVEDSKMVSNALKREFARLNYKADQAFSFAESKKLLTTKEYDLIILDLHLPDGEGYDLIDDIKSLSRTKVIILTANKEHLKRDKLFESGIVDYIVKDSNLVNSVKEVLKSIKNIEQIKNSKILLIDDSKFIHKQLKNVLEARNYLYDGAFSGSEGLEKLEEGSYDLLILDIELGDINGADVLKIIKKNHKFDLVPVIILSGAITPELTREVLRGGANDLMKKPFIFEEFILKVDLWISYYKKDKIIKEQNKELAKLNSQLNKMVEEKTKENLKHLRHLQQQSRLAQMGEMISMIAHQWRQPLSAINSAIIGIEAKLQIGKFDFSCQADRDKFLNFLIKKHKNIKLYVKTLSETIDDFRNFYKPDRQKEYVSVIEPIEKALNISKSSLESSGVEVKKVYNYEGEVQIFKNEIMQVILNILKNSKDNFVQNSILTGEILIFVQKINKSVVIEICDNGGGIPKDVLPNIFDPYFSTKNEKNGTGLGLYMSKIIVEEHHNGKFEAFNRDNGACFRIVLEE